MIGLVRPRILLTRDAADCAAWAAEIEALGAGVPVVFPCIECRDLDGPALRVRLAGELPRARWIVFTSRRGVSSFARLLGRGSRPDSAAGQADSRPGPTRETGTRVEDDVAPAATSGRSAASRRPARRRSVPAAPAVYGAGIPGSAGRRAAGHAAGALPPGVRVAAVGPATARAATEAFGGVALAGGAGGTAASLAGALVTRLEPGDRVLIAVAENAGRTLESAVAAAGHAATRLDVYRTRPRPVRRPRHAFSGLGADNVFFASPTAVTGFVNQVRLDTVPAVFTIGPSTTAAARSAGLAVTGEAPRPGLRGLLEAMRCAT